MCDCNDLKIKVGQMEVSANILNDLLLEGKIIYKYFEEGFGTSVMYTFDIIDEILKKQLDGGSRLTIRFTGPIKMFHDLAFHFDEF